MMRDGGELELRQDEGGFTVKVLGQEDVAQFREVRLRGLRECPLAFGQSSEEFEVLADEPIIATYLQNSDDRFTLGVFSNNSLLGIGGLLRTPEKKVRHRAAVWGVYVLPDARGAGVARLLMSEVIKRARSLPDLLQVDLKVTSTQKAAEALYRRMGFVPWGTEPRARRVGEDFIDEVHMVLGLDDTD